MNTASQAKEIFGCARNKKDIQITDYDKLTYSFINLQTWANVTPMPPLNKNE